jgi:protein-tyrosine phosphatase
MQVEGAHNFRDIGGYRTRDGLQVRSGLLFRSDTLSRFRVRDWRALEECGVRTIVDFREPYERDNQPYQHPAFATVHELAIAVGGQDIRRELEEVVRGRSDRDVNEVLVEIGRALVTDHLAVYRRWLRMLVDQPDALPQVFHCSAGKDRTGFAAALILRILDVPEETVFTDYLLSNKRLEQFVRRTLRKVRLLTLSRRKAELVRPLMIADRRYLAASFAAVDEQYGDFERFLASGLELSQADVEHLRNRLLEPGLQ